MGMYICCCCDNYANSDEGAEECKTHKFGLICEHCFSEGKTCKREEVMILKEEQRKDFEEAARPLIKWLNDNCHPHVTVVVNPSRAELSEGIYSFPTEDYIKD